MITSLRSFLGLGFVAVSFILAVMITAASSSQQYIVAVVNDDLVSRRDVDNRLDFIIGTSGLDNTSEVRQSLLPHVIQTLVDEHVKVQYARDMQLNVNDTEVLDAIGTLEQQNGLPSGGLDHLIENHQLDRVTVFDQVRSEVAWYKVIQYKIRPLIKIGETEIDSALQRIRDLAGLSHNLLSEIFLYVENTEKEQAVHLLAQHLVETLRSGKDFKAVAHQFSQSASSANGGDLGWVAQGQMSPEAESILAYMQPGQFSSPIRTQLGYVILLLRERHPSSQETLFSMSQLLMPTNGPNALSPEVRSSLISEAKKTSSCVTFNTLAGKTQIPQSGSLGWIKASDLPPVLRATVFQLKLNTVSAPLTLADNSVMLMVCERVDSLALAMPSREEVAHRLEIEKISLLQNHKLRGLRRAAFIEIRL